MDEKKEFLQQQQERNWELKMKMIAFQLTLFPSQIRNQKDFYLFIYVTTCRKTKNVNVIKTKLLG